MVGPQGSTGSVDLARVALRAAREAAKNQPAAGTKPKRRPSSRRRNGRDPVGIASALEQLAAERAWTAPTAAGTLGDRWAQIAPKLAGHVHPAGFDADTGSLDLQPLSPAYATQVRLYQAELIRRINTALGGPVVRTLRVLSPHDVTPGPLDTQAAPAAPPPSPGPVRTRETASEGYRRTLAAHQASRREHPVDPEVKAAYDRQSASPLMREPEHLFGDGQAAIEARRTASAQILTVSASEAAHGRALRRLAAERAGLVSREASKPLGRTA